MRGTDSSATRKPPTPWWSETPRTRSTNYRASTSSTSPNRSYLSTRNPCSNHRRHKLSSTSYKERSTPNPKKTTIKSNSKTWRLKVMFMTQSWRPFNKYLEQRQNNSSTNTLWAKTQITASSKTNSLLSTKYISSKAFPCISSLLASLTRSTSSSRFLLYKISSIWSTATSKIVSVSFLRDPWRIWTKIMWCATWMSNSMTPHSLGSSRNPRKSIWKALKLGMIVNGQLRLLLTGLLCRESITRFSSFWSISNMPST